MVLLKRIKPILASLVVISILLYILSLNYNTGPMTFLERAIMETVSPVQKGVHHVFRYFGDFFDHYINLVGVKEENNKLKNEIVSLNNELNVYREAYFANQRLRKLLGFKKNFLSWPTLPAEVITWEPSGWFQCVTIDKGFLDGVQMEMPVINAYGVVGKVIALSSHYSRVLLLIDPNCAIDGFVQRNRIHGIITGYKDRMCRMQYVQQNQDVKEGDDIVTSGIAGIFPKGLPIGKVVAVKNNRARLFQEIYIKPYANYSKLEEVLVVLEERPIVSDGRTSGKRGSSN